MILPYTKLIGLPVIDLKNQQLVGKVKDIILSKEDFKIAGISLEHFLWEKPKVISGVEILGLETEGVLVKDSESVSFLSDNVRLKEAVSKGYHGIGQKVVTKSGKSLGKVRDYFISNETLTISKLYVKGTFSERIVPISTVVKYEKRKIIVKDSFEGSKTVPVVGASII